jgi:Carboxypeptidase regulatory-like domain/TonB dependent receptor-like, beta-barrel
MLLRPISVLLVAALIVAASPANKLNAQTTTSGGLTGVVTDPSHAVIPDTGVEIKDEAKGTTQSTKTDREGVYRFFFLAPGRYTLTVTHDGFRKESRAVNVLLGPPVSVNVTLQVANANTSVSVTAEAPLIQAENGDVSTTMNEKQVSEVPNPGNDLTYIAQTAPGAIMNTDMQAGANFSILGMPGSSYRYTVDGLSDTDNFNRVQLVGALFLLLGQNQIEEATVVSTGYSGQFGGAAGGNINYITKSGGNEYHGNAQYYWNGRVFNANDWFRNAFDVPRLFDIANQWAGSFGGPLKKNKLFVFFDTEGLRLLIPQNFAVVIPSPQFEEATIKNIDSKFTSTSASDTFYHQIFGLYNSTLGAAGALPGGFSPTDPTGCTGFPNLGANVPCAVHFLSTRGRPSQDALTSGRVDWNASNSDRAFLRLQYDHGRSAYYTDPISPLFDVDLNLPWVQGQVIETHTFGSSAASQFLFAGSYIAPIYGLENPSQTLAAFPTILGFWVPGTFTNLGGEDNAFALGSGEYYTQYQLSEDVVKTSRGHKFGFGASFERNYTTLLQYTPNSIGVLVPRTLDAFYQGGMDPSSSGTDFTQLNQTFPAASSQRLAFNSLGLYAQDEWHARPNLTLTLGLRAEHQSNPTCQSRCFARLSGPFDSVSHDPGQPYNQAILTNQKYALAGIDHILWSPRFSLAWQPFGVSHGAVLRGGVGIFYDPVPGGLGLPFSSNSPLVNSYTILSGNLAPKELNSLSSIARVSNMEFVDGFNAGATLAQLQSTDPNFSPPEMNIPNGRTRAPQYQRWSLELQQAFRANTSLSIGYFGHHGIHELTQNNSANAYCNPAESALPSGGANPCFGFVSDLPLSVPDPRFSQVTEYSSVAVSNYNGMVVSFRHQFSRWGNGLFQLNYTYGHTFDEVSNGGLFPFTFGSSLYPQDPNNLRGSYGPAEYDVRHSINANYVWELPVKAAFGGHGPDYLVKGWQVSGTIFARTGFPYTVFDNAESSALAQNNYFGSIYAVPIGPLPPGSPCGEGAAIPLAPHPCLPPQVLANGNPNRDALFVQEGCETGFNAGHLGPSGSCLDGPVVSFAQGRNRFRYPSYFNTDFSIMKSTKIPGRENAVLGIGFQFFNFFNHPNFSGPDNYSSDPGFGQIQYLEQPPTSILGNGFGGDVAPRMIQLKAQLRF